MPNKNPKQLYCGTTESMTATGSVGHALGHRQTGATSYIFIVVCVLAQLATVLITWPLWQIRHSPINLPWVSGLPQIPFGFLLLVSLVGVLISPKKVGLSIHLGILTAAILTDQMRCQPQVIWVAVLTIGCVRKSARPFCAWALVSLWLWAGIHKLLSAEWFGANSLLLLQQAGIDRSADWCYWFALTIGAGELIQGLLAIARPRIAALTGMMLHLGITGFMLFIQWNLSVVPWNVCTAIVGSWLMYQGSAKHHALKIPVFSLAKSSRTVQHTPRARRLIERLGHLQWLPACAVACLLLTPLGVYTGHVRHCFAHVLYSGNLPLAAISKLDGSVQPLEGWETIRVPFPHEPKAFLDYFSATGFPGEKMHIHEVRPWLKSRYYLVDRRHQIQEISQQQFYDSQYSIAGIGYDDRCAVYQLANQGTLMKRRNIQSMIFAIQFSPELFTRNLLDLVSALPNVEEIQLRGCDVNDTDLEKLTSLKKLQGVGLNDTPVTIEGLKYLAKIESLEFIEFRDQIYSSVEEIENALGSEP